MSWSKLKQQLESFLCPALAGRVEYTSTSYRFVPDKAGLCNITVDKKNILAMSHPENPIRWYLSEQEIKHDASLQLPLSLEEIEAVRRDTKGAVPEERLKVMARSRKMSEHAKALMAAQAVLCRSSFTVAANTFLTTPIEESLESKDILFNILALVDRRVGKKRILNMAEKIRLKHPIVLYFYELRLGVI